jgi:phytoene synthase
MSARRRADDGPVTLERSYAECRRLNRAHGTTYYLATCTLPRVKRHHVHALYGFCRFADEIVDDPQFGTVVEREKALAQFDHAFHVDLARGTSDDLVLKAVVHTVRAFDLDVGLFDRFLRSMAMDLTVTSYGTWDDLQTYVDGSAAVIGEMMVPILEPTDPDASRHAARALGVAFQLTNFLRDVGEDLDRGRVYLPQEDLRRFGAEPARRRVDDAWLALARFEIDRCRQLYAEADEGIEALPASSARSIRAARDLYAGILTQIEANGYDVFTTRARVPQWRKLAVVAREALTPAGGLPGRRR